MTNPNNAVGTNAAYGGRTSVNAFNDDLTIYSRGILSGWSCSPKSGMTVQIGGNGSERDVAAAEDNAGNKTSINNISGSPIDVTIPAAPATNNRIDLIVAYADNPPSGTSTVVDNPAACGIIVVSGTAAASPTAPTNATIRSAITADGASGSTAYYVILAQIRVGTGVTTIGSGVITQGDVVISNAQLADSSVTSDKIDFATFLDNVFTYSGARTTTGIFTTVPAGKYLLVWHARFSTSGSEGWANVVIRHGSISLPAHTSSGFIVNDGHTPVVGQSAVITASSDEAITLHSISTSGSILLQSCNLSIFGIKS